MHLFYNILTQIAVTYSNYCHWIEFFSKSDTWWPFLSPPCLFCPLNYIIHWIFIKLNCGLLTTSSDRLAFCSRRDNTESNDPGVTQSKLHAVTLWIVNGQGLTNTSWMDWLIWDTKCYQHFVWSTHTEHSSDKKSYFVYTVETGVTYLSILVDLPAWKTWKKNWIPM